MLYGAAHRLERRTLPRCVQRWLGYPPGRATGLDHLVVKGHGAPALIVGPRSRLARARFLRAEHEHCAACDVDPDILPIGDGEYTVEGGRQAMRRLLAQPRPGHLAVVAANDMMALGAMMAVRDAGLDCPRDVSILGFDGIPSGEFAWPGLTRVAKPGRGIGERAVQSLFDEIEHKPEHRRICMPCRLIERGPLADLSTAAPQRAVGAGRV